ncbi:hypothetical protein C0992_001190 [Termitomyces sp. T32_za158]|nr:hypothetical protein C0992_001190 [Termitomyces sp. T32_za158]
MGSRVINPPSVSAYNQYLAAAKSVTAAVPSKVATVLTGQFASATAPPGFTTTPVPVTTPITSPVTSTPTSTSSSITSPPTTPTEEPTKNSKTGAIIGGSVAGVVALLAILTFIVCFVFRRRKRTSRESKDFFHYQAPTRTVGSGPESLKPLPFVGSPTDNAYKDLPTPMTQSTPTSASSVSSPPVSTHPYSTATPRVSDFNLSSPPTRTKSLRRLPPTPLPLPPPTVPKTNSPMAERKLPLPPARANTLENGGDIHALAREVVAVLSQGQSDGSRDASYRYSINRGESPAPPGYRSVIGV